MSYFDPEYYTEEKLTEDQRAEIEYWRGVFDSAVQNVLDDMEDKTILGKIVKEIAEKVTAEVMENVEDNISSLVVSLIDSAE